MSSRNLFLHCLGRDPQGMRCVLMREATQEHQRTHGLTPGRQSFDKPNGKRASLRPLQPVVGQRQHTLQPGERHGVERHGPRKRMPMAQQAHRFPATSFAEELPWVRDRPPGTGVPEARQQTLCHVLSIGGGPEHVQRRRIGDVEPFPVESGEV